MPVPSHESKQPCICVLEVSILPLSVIFLSAFGTVQTLRDGRLQMVRFKNHNRKCIRDIALIHLKYLINVYDILKAFNCTSHFCGLILFAFYQQTPGVWRISFRWSHCSFSLYMNRGHTWSPPPPHTHKLYIHIYFPTAIYKPTL